MFASKLIPFLLTVAFGLVVESRVVAAEKPHVVIVVGTHHYSPHRSMPLFEKELQRLGFRTTLVMGEGDPEKKTDDVLPGIAALDAADVAVFYMRFLNLPDDEWGPIQRYIKSGKPVIGLRTCNHAVKFTADSPHYHWNESFGRRVLGTPYIAHQSTKTNVNIVKQHVKHPILAGVGSRDWESPAKLYLTRLQPGCVPLLAGEGQGNARVLEKNFGTIHTNRSETDIVAWTWTNEWQARVFATSLGHAGDFAEESFTRMLVNGICWAADRQPPAATEKIATWDIKMEVPSTYIERK